MKIHSKLNKFRIKKLNCYIVSDLRFLLEIQAILPETSPFLSAQMAVLSSFFQLFIVLGMYNFVSKVVHPGLTQVVLAEPLAEKSKWEAIERISLMAVVYTTSLSHLDPIGNSMGGGFNFVNPQNM